MDQIAVLIPCYNEEKTITKVIRDAQQALPNAKIYVYNNNSTDMSSELASSAGAIVRKECKQGKGNVIRRMFREVDAECYIMVDGDDTYPLNSAPEMANRILQHNADMVVGDRLSSTYFNENKRPFHNFGNSLVRNSINHLFSCNIRDVMTGFRAFSYEFVKTFPVLSTGFEIETEMTIHAVYNNMQIDNVIIEYRDRPDGSISKLNTYSDGLRVLTTIVNLCRNYKPLFFYGFLSLILSILSVIFFIPVLIDFFRTGNVNKFPTLIMCCFTFTASLQSFFAGLILSNQEKSERRKFEILRNIIYKNKSK